jgi:hypothetical protein
LGARYSSEATSITVSAAELRARCDELAETLHLVLACDDGGTGKTWEMSRLRARKVLRRYSAGPPSAESELLRVSRRVLFYAQRDPRVWHPETLEAFRDMQEVLDGFG